MNVAYALRNRDTVMSVITDGMDQTHSMCPWLGNMNSFKNSLKQHIQGVLEHGKGELRGGYLFCHSFFSLAN